jgi:hypothetical protein
MQARRSLGPSSTSGAGMLLTWSDSEHSRPGCRGLPTDVLLRPAGGCGHQDLQGWLPADGHVRTLRGRQGRNNGMPGTAIHRHFGHAAGDPSRAVMGRLFWDTRRSPARNPSRRSERAAPEGGMPFGPMFCAASLLTPGLPVPVCGRRRQAHGALSPSRIAAFKQYRTVRRRSRRSHQALPIALQPAFFTNDRCSSGTARALDLLQGRHERCERTDSEERGR